MILNYVARLHCYIMSLRATDSGHSDTFQHVIYLKITNALHKQINCVYTVFRKNTPLLFFFISMENV